MLKELLRHRTRHRVVALVMVLLACVASIITLGTRTPKAEAAPVDVVFPSETTFSAGFNLHNSSDHIFIVNNHSAADEYSAKLYGYCMQTDKQGPWDDTWTLGCVYRGTYWGTLYGMIMTNGWPNTNTIFGHTYSDAEAAGITQEAVWACALAEAHNDPNYHGNGLNGMGWSLYETVRNYLNDHPDIISNSSDLANNICAFYKSPNSNKQNVLVVTTKPYGYITVDKSPSDTVTVTGAMASPFYASMAGAEYTLYTTRACTTPVKTVANTDAVYVIDENGHSISHRFPPGRYYLKETKAPTGYKLDPTVIGVNATSATTYREGVKDEPIVGYIKVIKKDASTGETVALAGFEFDLYQKDGTTPLVHGVTGDDGTVTFDANLALGEYEVLETAVPAGTNWTVNTTRQAVTLTQDGSAGAITGASSAHEDGDPNNVVHVEISDTRSSASIVTDLVTSSNGKTITLTESNSSSTVNLTDKVTYQGLDPSLTYYLVGELHRKSDSSLLGSQVTSDALTPAASGSGTFTMTLPLDLSGITASDTVVAFEELHVGSADGDIVGSHKNINDSRQSITFKTPPPNVVKPSIGTSFATANGGKSITRSQTTISLVDTVTYANLDPSKTYTLSGAVYMTNGTRLLSSTPVSTSTKEFQPESEDGSTTLTFSINLRNVTSAKLVAYEDLKIGTDIVASHKVPSDTNQTVSITDAPTIGTTLATADGAKTFLDDDSTITLKDKVTYSGLTPGHSYKLVGELRIKDGSANGTKVEGSDGEKTFSASGGSSSTTVDLPLNLALVNGKSVVAFEKLYDGDTVVTEHEDINDSNQTVTPLTPSIGTTLATVDGGKELFPSSVTVTLKDTVAYSNLIPGKQYEMKGQLQLKNGDSGTPLGNVVTVPFTPDSASGTVVVDLPISFAGIDHLTMAGMHSPVVAFEELYLDGTLIAEHKDANDENQTVIVRHPKIGTTLVTGDGGKDFFTTTGEPLTLTDTVAYQGLIPGKEYEMRATMHAKDGTTDKGVVEGATKTQRFTPSAADGTVDVTITVDLSKFEGTGLVAFEQLYFGTDLIAVHEDISDENQTVEPHTPSIGTRLATIDGEVAIHDTNKVVRVTDTVEYENLVPGREYTLSGTIHARGDGKDDGAIEGATATKTFTPEEPSGTIQMEFEVDLSKFDGDGMVAFEELWYGETKIADHSDIGDEGQTIEMLSPSIGTTLATIEGGKEVLKGIEGTTISLVDTVSYHNLIVGQEYVLRGELHAKGADGSDAGAIKGSAGEVTFTPETKDGEASVTLTLDLGALTTDEAVAFEELYVGEELIAEHKDITDTDQTIITKKPSIGTTLMTADGKKTLNAGGKGQVKLVDTIEYHNLIPGKEYEVRGEIHARNENGTDAGAIAGTQGSAKFTPQAADGKITVAMTIDMSNVTKTLVAFEELYGSVSDGKGGQQTVKLAEHKEIGDSAQSVTLTKAAGQASDILRTGDAVVPLGLGMITIGGCAWALARRRKKVA